MTHYRIYVCQYASNGNALATPKEAKPRHLEIVVRTGVESVATTSGVPRTKLVGSAFHIQGGTGNSWGYTPQHGVHYDNLGYSGRYCIGTMPASAIALKALQDLLGTITLRNGNPQWNCQSWVWEALLLMRQEKYQVKLPPTFGHLDAIMDKAWDNWNDSQESD
ncbi:hypothetical protein FOMPIDRAFT_84998 [Fomitopsis schrenkii]|uniref:Uncharacterized protein n=1 Tax=Fomitopsis schrenkii TaxID=2126942 RepID=S8DPH3_FOMSC|nr:hypothetical protein FOMPIDRAFT_84998 [Fomitopsis schrenkii]